MPSPVPETIMSLKLDLYFTRILAQFYPTARLTKDAKETLNDFVIQFLYQFVEYMVTVMMHKQTKTLSHRDAQTATQLLFEGLLRRYAISEGVRAITKYAGFMATSRRRKGRVRDNEKAGVILPPSRIRRYLVHTVPTFKYHIRISKEAVLYVTAVTDYILYEIIEHAGKDKSVITSQDIKHVFDNDREISKTVCRL